MVLNEALPGGISICQRDPGNRVLRQNPACVELCGKRVGSICEDGCMAILAGADGGRAAQTRLLQGRRLNGRYFDLVMISNADGSLTVLNPLAEVPGQDVIAALDRLDFTPREREIASLMVEGMPNAEIARRLFVAMSTVKTHVNRIYEKLGPDLSSRLFPAVSPRASRRTARG